MRAMILALIVGACAGAPPINSFCAWFVPADFTDSGLLKLSPDNKRSLIANEHTRMRECLLGNQAKPGGPR